ncbi:MAG TPA: DMT family transporter [Casimicrobiaceae bacterium]|nr:DMT family transporter [Casimicrobiaceae bacterium]
MTTRAAFFALHVSVALFGFAALFGKWIALPATVIVLGRTAIAAAALVVVARARSRPIGRPDTALAMNGALLALHWVSFFAAIQVASVAVGLLGYASFPVFVLLLELQLLKRGAPRLEYLTALLATAGLVVLVPDFSWSSRVTRGLALGLVSGFTFAWLTVRNRRLVGDQSPLRLALWQNVFAAACLLPIVAIVDRASAWPTGAELGLLVVLGVVCTALAHTLFIASMRRVSAHSASVVAALEPVYGIALAALLLHEIPSGRTIVGGALIVAAAMLASFVPTLATRVGFR